MRRHTGPPDSRSLPDSVVSELLDAGLSRGTVQAMEGWKAQEVLDLLRALPSSPAAGSPPRLLTVRRGGRPGGPHGTFGTQD
jgi:hypothetical protein